MMNAMPSGRFAPSPSGPLHLGNLRTALVAWLFARSDASTFLLRFDDLDQASVRPEHYDTQIADLKAIGLDWDGVPIRQTDRLDRYQAALDRLIADDLVYPCYCSRREVREAALAPNHPLAGHRYPGTCRHLDQQGRAEREASGRPPALRLRLDEPTVGFDDRIAGPVSFPVDDFVVQRGDGTPAYHLVNVVDDADLGIELVLRADDLLDSTSRQLILIDLLGLDRPTFGHIPLVLAPSGDRLAKRHGAVTLSDRVDRGETEPEVLSFLASTLGLCTPDEPVTAADLLPHFDPASLPTDPFTLPDDYLT